MTEKKSVRITTLSDTKRYLRELLIEPREEEGKPRINHAFNLDFGIVSLMYTFLTPYHDDGSFEIDTYYYKGVQREVNTMRFTINGRLYTLTYGKHTKKIEIKNGGKQSPTIYIVDKTTRLYELENMFADLASGCRLSGRHPVNKLDEIGVVL
jgi:hypothetical protein